ncbi:MAG: hypothetical protein H0T79_10635 [Deltaproteobacteria bacterium]|nr:hypothetical protein [Deltaproteobacteria bacterium]
MSRLAVLSVLLAFSTVTACSKSAANQDVPSKDPGAPKKIVVPTEDEGTPPKDLGMTGGQGTAEVVPAKGGADDRYKLKATEGKLAIDVPADIKPGTEAVAKITVTPGSGFKVNTEYPTKLTLQSPSGVTLAKSEFIAGGSDKAKGDADALDDHQLVLTVKLTAAQPGNYTINGSFKFAVCDKDQCLAKKETIAIAVAAK